VLLQLAALDVLVVGGRLVAAAAAAAHLDAHLGVVAHLDDLGADDERGARHDGQHHGDGGEEDELDARALQVVARQRPRRVLAVVEALEARLARVVCPVVAVVLDELVALAAQSVYATLKFEHFQFMDWMGT